MALSFDENFSYFDAVENCSAQSYAALGPNYAASIQAELSQMEELSDEEACMIDATSKEITNDAVRERESKKARTGNDASGGLELAVAPTNPTRAVGYASDPLNCMWIGTKEQFDAFADEVENNIEINGEKGSEVLIKCVNKILGCATENHPGLLQHSGVFTNASRCAALSSRFNIQRLCKCSLERVDGLDRDVVSGTHKCDDVYKTVVGELRKLGCVKGDSGDIEGPFAKVCSPTKRMNPGYNNVSHFVLQCTMLVQKGAVYAIRKGRFSPFVAGRASCTYARHTLDKPMIFDAWAENFFTHGDDNATEDLCEAIRFPREAKLRTSTQKGVIACDPGSDNNNKGRRWVPENQAIADANSPTGYYLKTKADGREFKEMRCPNGHEFHYSEHNLGEYKGTFKPRELAEHPWYGVGCYKCGIHGCKYVGTEPWFYSDATEEWCLCGRGDGVMFQCDAEGGCGNWFHPECLGLAGPPDGDYLCKKCRDASEDDDDLVPPAEVATAPAAESLDEPSEGFAKMRDKFDVETTSEPSLEPSRDDLIHGMSLFTSAGSAVRGELAAMGPAAAYAHLGINVGHNDDDDESMDSLEWALEAPLDVDDGDESDGGLWDPDAESSGESSSDGADYRSSPRPSLLKPEPRHLRLKPFVYYVRERGASLVASAELPERDDLEPAVEETLAMLETNWGGEGDAAKGELLSRVPSS